MSPSRERPLAQRHTLTVDLGTGGPKVGLVSFAGQLRWSAHRVVPVSYTHLTLPTNREV